MKKVLVAALLAVGLAGCTVHTTPVVYSQPTYVAPRPVYVAPAPVYVPQPRYYRPAPVCRQFYAGRDYYGRPVYRTACH